MERWEVEMLAICVGGGAVCGLSWGLTIVYLVG